MKKNLFTKMFEYKDRSNCNEFILPNNPNNIILEENNINYVFNTLDRNYEFLKTKYNLLINSDINVREFVISTKCNKFNAMLLYIDGLVNSDSINDFILKPLLLKNSITMKENTTKPDGNSKSTLKEVKKFNLEDFIYNSLIPQNTISKETKFEDLIDKVNAGFCALFVDTIATSFCIEVKGIKGRSVSEPITETVIKGSHEGFVENLRVNTSLIRKIVNNENLVIEDLSVGRITKTKVALCYINNLTNDDLVAEVRYRLNNLEIDYLLSSGQLEQLIQDNPRASFPEFVSTERPDCTSSYLLNGKVAILINGSPYAIILPAILIDFLASPEDSNLNYHYANFLRLIRCFAMFFALLLPGLYVAITTYHQELIPSELLFAIVNAREAIPFPILFEILIMESSFELIQEASIRVSSSFSTTIGIIGALILGDAAVSANIVSPILIIIVAFTGICGFSIPNFSLKFSVRIFRFMYIILGYIAGFLGITFGAFVHFAFLCSQTSFGVPFISPYIPFTDTKSIDNLYMPPVWKRETRSSFLNTKQPDSEKHISMKWRKNEQQ